MNTYPVSGDLTDFPLPSGISTEPIDGITVSTGTTETFSTATIGDMDFDGTVSISTDCVDFTQRSEFDVIVEKLEHSLEHSHALEVKIDALSAKLDNIFKFD